MTTKAATIVLVPYNNPERALRRLHRDIVPSLAYHASWRFELLVIDNSTQRLDGLAGAVGKLAWPSQYLWHEGKNLLYGPALNLAANLAEHPFLVYVCTNHGRMVDPAWLEDLVRPLWA